MEAHVQSGAQIDIQIIEKNEDRSILGEEGCGEGLNPIDRVGFLSRWTWTWCSDLLSLGSRRALEQSDLWALQKGAHSRTLAKTFTKLWAAELAAARKHNRPPHVKHAFYKYFFPKNVSQCVIVKSKKHKYQNVKLEICEFLCL